WPRGHPDRGGRPTSRAGFVPWARILRHKALVPAVSRLVLALARGRDAVSQAGVGMSADSAGTIACAASHKLAGLPAVNMVHQLPFADRLGPFQAHEVSG